MSMRDTNINLSKSINRGARALWPTSMPPHDLVGFQRDAEEVINAALPDLLHALADAIWAIEDTEGFNVVDWLREQAQAAWE